MPKVILKVIAAHYLYIFKTHEIFLFPCKYIFYVTLLPNNSAILWGAIKRSKIILAKKSDNFLGSMPCKSNKYIS